MSERYEFQPTWISFLVIAQGNLWRLELELIVALLLCVVFTNWFPSRLPVGSDSCKRQAAANDPPFKRYRCRRS